MKVMFSFLFSSSHLTIIYYFPKSSLPSPLSPCSPPYTITKMRHNPDMAMHTNASGIITFQHRFISWSALKRGNVHRIHICIPTIVSDLINVQKIPHPSPVVQSASLAIPILGRGVFHPPKKMTTPNIATKNIMAYSARKMNAKRIPPYSV